MLGIEFDKLGFDAHLFSDPLFLLPPLGLCVVKREGSCSTPGQRQSTLQYATLQYDAAVHTVYVLSKTGSAHVLLRTPAPPHPSILFSTRPTFRGEGARFYSPLTRVQGTVVGDSILSRFFY